MIKKNSIKLSIFLLFLDVHAHMNKAVVRVPVADVAAASLKRYTSGNVRRVYERFTWAPDKGACSCMRVHQVKYNEVVTLKPSPPHNEEVECEVSHLFYLDGDNESRSHFWLLKKDLQFFESLGDKIDVATIPPAIDKAGDPLAYNDHILTLVEPWLFKKRQKVYSVGTRFVRARSKDTQKSYAVYHNDFDHLITEFALIPKSKGIVRYPKTSPQKRALFIKLLKSWADNRKDLSLMCLVAVALRSVLKIIRLCARMESFVVLRFRTGKGPIKRPRPLQVLIVRVCS